MLRYPATIVPDGDGFLVSFPDVPEALTGAATLAEAIEMAADALMTALSFYIEDGRTVPDPSKPLDGQVLISFPFEGGPQ